MENLENEIREYTEERGWDRQRPVDIAKSIIIESAELLEIFQWRDLSVEAIIDNEKYLEKVKSELADVFIYAIEMSLVFEFDTEEIILNKLKHVKQKYPADIIKNDDGSIYQEIKQKHRRVKNN